MESSPFSSIYIFTEEGINRKLLYLDDFVKLLKQNRNSGDRLSDIRRQNIIREIKGHKNGLYQLSHGSAVSVTSAMKYLFHHADDMQFCENFMHFVENSVIKQENFSETLLDLYKAIATTKPLTWSYEYLKSIFKVSTANIPTLQANYRGHFSEEEWTKISIFENYYSNYGNKSVFYIENVKSKWTLYKYLLTIKQMSGRWVSESHDVIKIRGKRKQAYEDSTGVELSTNLKHRPEVLDNFILGEIEKEFPAIIDRVVCVESVKGTGNSLDVFIQLLAESTRYTDISEHISMLLSNTHYVNCGQIYFMKPGVLLQYKRSNVILARFTLRDDFILGKLDESIYETVKPSMADIDCTFEDDTCLACYNSSFPEPRSAKTFNISKEWLTDIPLDIQIFLEIYINKCTLMKKTNKQSYICKKLEKLYIAYDMLLHILNKNYYGILQEANTDELAMNYRSINTVFAISNSAGVTTSLSSAEKKLKEKAIDDLCYYNTYLKKYPIEHETDAGIVTSLVNLRDCHLILMLDNLVRLKFHSDPNPGDSRSGQMCTLPISVQGLPKDAKVTETWHDASICNGTSNCQCKKTVLLEKKDIEPTLVEPSQEEKNSWDRFEQLCTWGVFAYWRQIQSSELASYFEMHEIVHEEHTLKNKPLLEKETSLCYTSHMYREKENNDKFVVSESGCVLSVECCDTEIVENEYLYFDDDDDGGDDNDDDECYFANEKCLEVESILSDSKFSFTNPGSSKQNSIEPEDNEQELFDLLSKAEIETKNHDTEDELSKYFHKLDSSFGDISNNSFTTDSEETSLKPGEYHPLISTNNEMPSTSDDTTKCINSQNIPAAFGFKKYSPPPLLCRHPPPATGKDDDINKLREILIDVLIKTGRHDTEPEYCDRILMGPDSKIGINLLTLVEKGGRFKNFLPEFPLLHLRKSKINTLFSSYKSAGLVEILMYMKDNEGIEWSKLISADHIDMATKNVRRLSQAFHLAFLIQFYQTLDKGKKQLFYHDLHNNRQNEVSKRWNDTYVNFLQERSLANCTFALHVDMMRHCDEVIAISLSERLGGRTGYSLLMSAVKSSLLFAFVNGASSYAPYCVKLLKTHYEAGYFHQRLKHTLYSTPIGKSNVNFACDTKREMDHQDALKGFRSGSNLSSVTCRMSLIDPFNEVHSQRKQVREERRAEKKDSHEESDNLGWETNGVDFNHIFRTTALILRRGGLSHEPCNIPYNVYTDIPKALPKAILDAHSFKVGFYLLERYLARENLFGCTIDDLPNINCVAGPISLVKRAYRSKGNTIKRATEKPVTVLQTERDVKEVARTRQLKRENIQTACLSSDMNTCQALVKPDCSKPKVLKSAGMKKALQNLLSKYKPELEKDKLLYLNTESIPSFVTKNLKFITYEFAGIKFKTRAISGTEYIKYVERNILKRFFFEMPSLRRIIICEEKYSFTPDSFKAATRAQRKKNNAKISIAHLKTSDAIISSSKFSKEAIVTTSEGKSLISTFLASNADALSLPADAIIDIDSEYHLVGCSCEGENTICSCNKYTIPVRCNFSKSGRPVCISKLESIHQRKGEAEMAQVDWLFSCIPDLQEGESIASIVSSGDIDAVVIHLFALSLKWPRNADGKFRYPVFVILQKMQMPSVCQLML